MISGVTETGDKAAEADLRTRYFRNRKKEAIEAIREFTRKWPQFRLIHVDEQRGEVMLETRNGIGLIHDFVVTVYEINPIKIAVDIHAALRAKFLDFGWNRKFIRLIFRHLENELQLETKRE